VHIKAPNLLLQKYEKAQEKKKEKSKKKKEKRKTKSPSPGHKNSHLFI